MKKPAFTSRFKRDIKLAKKRKKDLSKIEVVYDSLLSEKPLPPQYYDHLLKGDYAGKRECHLEPDWLLIYSTTEEYVIFERLGTHSDLFDM